MHAPTLGDISGVKNNLTYTLSPNLDRVVGGAGQGLRYQHNTPTFYYDNASSLVSNKNVIVISAVVQKMWAGNPLVVLQSWQAYTQLICKIEINGSITWGVYQDSSNVLVKSTAAGTIQPDKIYSLVVAFENGEMSCFINGTPVAFEPGGWIAGTVTATSIANQHLITGGDSSNWHAGTIYHLAAWTRPGLPKQKLSGNPWQIFQPIDRKAWVSA